MDRASNVEITERTRFCPQTDWQMDRRMDNVKCIMVIHMNNTAMKHYILLPGHWCYLLIFCITGSSRRFLFGHNEQNTGTLWFKCAGLSAVGGCQWGIWTHACQAARTVCVHVLHSPLNVHGDSSLLSVDPEELSLLFHQLWCLRAYHMVMEPHASNCERVTYKQ